MRRTGLENYASSRHGFTSILTEPRCICRRLQHGLNIASHRSIDRSWNSIILVCVKSGNPQHALHLYQEMQTLGSSLQLNGHTYVCLLKACAVLKDLQSGLHLHAEVARTGNLRNSFVGSTLVDVYVKCGLLAKAQEAFDGLFCKDVVAWTMLMAGYAEHGCTKEALLCFEKMQLDGASLDAHAFVCILNVCSSIRALEKGEYIHFEVERLGMVEENLFVASALVDLYAKCGLLGKAQEVFDRCVYQNAVLWNALILGYAEHGYGEEALEKYEEMRLNGISPTSASYVSVLKTCGSVGALDKGREIHTEIERQGLLEADDVAANVLVDMYATCGVLIVAQEVFDRLPIQDVVSWTVLISGYVQHGQYLKAVEHFDQMQIEGVLPNAATYVCVLKACGNVKAATRGHGLHAKLEIWGLVGRDAVVSNALVNMYSKCGMFSMAQRAFDKLLVRDVVSWTALIVGYVEHGQGQKALECYEKMRCQGVLPNEITLIYVAKACGSIGAIEKADGVCAEVERQRLLETDLDLGNALVDAYAKCGSLFKAHDVFYKLPTRDSVSYGTLITGYAEHGNGEDALKCFDEMQLEGVFPSAITYACVLKACGSLGAKERGSEIHVEIEKRGLLETNSVIGNNLVDMYAKFGFLANAQHAFNRLPVHDLVSWNALIGGYAWLGESEVVFSCFECMRRESLNPDGVTFVVLLSACSRVGLFVGNKDTPFETMSKEYGMVPWGEHYVWMIDLFGQLGQLDMATAMIKRMPSCLTDVVWHAMLCACNKWGSLEYGVQAFKHTACLL